MYFVDFGHMENKKERQSTMDDIIGPSAYMHLLGMKIEEAAYPHARLSLSYDEKLTNPMGTLHGGVIASLIDAALGCALFQDAKVRGIATLELKVNYLKAVSGGKIFAEGEIIHRRGSMAFGQVRIYNDKDLAAMGSATYRLIFQ
jgi:acyl-CoA thioesterase